MANTLPARLGRNYLKKIGDREKLHEEINHQLRIDILNLTLRLESTEARNRELESVVKLQEEVIDALRTKPKRRAIG